MAKVIESQKESVLSDGPRAQFKQIWWTSDKPSYLEVAFKRPVVLPTKVTTRFQDTPGKDPQVAEFDVMRGEKINVNGKVGWL